MKCPPCTGDCQQSDTCPARADDVPPVTFDDVAEMVRDLFAAVGFVLMVGLIAFVWGYNV